MSQTQFEIFHSLPAAYKFCLFELDKYKKKNGIITSSTLLGKRERERTTVSHFQYNPGIYSQFHTQKFSNHQARLKQWNPLMIKNPSHKTLTILWLDWPLCVDRKSKRGHQLFTTPLFYLIHQNASEGYFTKRHTVTPKVISMLHDI